MQNIVFKQCCPHCWLLSLSGDSDKIMESQNGVGWKGPLGSSHSNPPATGRDATQMLLSAQEMHTCTGIFVHKYPYSICVLDIQAYLTPVEIPIYQTPVPLTDLAVFTQTLMRQDTRKAEIWGDW